MDYYIHRRFVKQLNPITKDNTMAAKKKAVKKKGVKKKVVKKKVTKPDVVVTTQTYKHCVISNVKHGGPSYDRALKFEVRTALTGTQDGVAARDVMQLPCGDTMSFFAGDLEKAVKALEMYLTLNKPSKADKDGITLVVTQEVRVKLKYDELRFYTAADNRVIFRGGRGRVQMTPAGAKALAAGLTKYLKA